MYLSVYKIIIQIIFIYLLTYSIVYLYMVYIYTMIRNEEEILPYFIEWYRSRLRDTHFIVYDQGSTDRSRSMATEMGAIVIPIEGRYFSNQLLNDNRNNCWKYNEPSWVIMADVDEFLEITQDDLDNCEGTHVKGVGYDMVGTGESFFDMKYGVRNPLYDKTLAFNTNYITDMRYTIGGHTCNPVGNKVKEWWNKPDLYHMRYPSLDYLLKRHKDIRDRRDPEEAKLDWGIQFSWSDEALKAVYQDLLNRRIQVR